MTGEKSVKKKVVSKKPVKKKTAVKKVTKKGAPIRSKGVKSIVINKYYYNGKEGEKKVEGGGGN